MVNRRPDNLEFLGVEFSPLQPGQVVDEIFELSRQGAFSYVVTPNVAHIVDLAEEKKAGGERINDAVKSATLRLCDSRILVHLARLSGIALPLATGSDLTADVIGDPRLNGLRVAVIGSSRSSLTTLKVRRPLVDFVQHIPPMGVREDAEVQNAIVRFLEAADADIILFAIGFPQSEIVAQTLARRQRARGVGLCIGASIAFVVGETRRAPRWVQALSLEWAHRLASEPRRLWRRYLIEGPKVFRIWHHWRSRQR